MVEIKINKFTGSSADFQEWKERLCYELMGAGLDNCLLLNLKLNPLKQIRLILPLMLRNSVTSVNTVESFWKMRCSKCGSYESIV